MLLGSLLQKIKHDSNGLHYKVLNYVYTYDSHYYSSCYMYVLVYLQHSYTFLLRIRLFLECGVSILLISLVA
jgi:hypothetical protein